MRPAQLQNDPNQRLRCWATALKNACCRCLPLALQKHECLKPNTRWRPAWCACRQDAGCSGPLAQVKLLRGCCAAALTAEGAAWLLAFAGSLGSLGLRGARFFFGVGLIPEQEQLHERPQQQQSCWAAATHVRVCTRSSKGCESQANAPCLRWV